MAMRAAAVAVLLVLTGCRGDAAPAAATPAPTAAASGGHALGIGAARVPEPFTLSQRLLDAVQRNDRAAIERALERGASVDARDDLGRSTVLLAVSDAGDLELVQWLHGKGAALDVPDVGGRTALSFAAAAGRLDIVRYLAEQGVAIERPDGQRRTPLFHAALGDHSDVIAFLLDHGADADVRDQFGDTPLIVACAKGNAAAAGLLVARGADASARDQEGRTARDRAAPGLAVCGVGRDP